ncbi:YheC/YheD family endospore coat-associated protein [Falsibacillus albus]|nr:YheC/YheD family protein [Falsibacillus albus]
MSHKISFHISNTNGLFTSSPQLHLNPLDGKKLNIDDNSRITIKIGNKTAAAIVHFNSDEPEGSAAVEPALYQSLLLPIQTYKWHVLYDVHDQLLKLGPFISILTEFKHAGHDQPSFGSIHCFAEELQTFISKEGGLLSIMNLSDNMNLGEESKGFIFYDDAWIMWDLPEPDVIYNRIHSRKTERTKAYLVFYEHYLQSGSTIFNPQFLSKWEVYQLLGAESHMNPFIPETNLYSESTFDDFLGKYGAVYIKPVHGSLGRGIIEVTKHSDGLFIVNQTYFPEQKEHTFESLTDVKNAVHKWIGKRICIIQQALSLLEKDGRKIDFRLLTHPDAGHHWRVTSAVARISGENQFVSNLAQGGVLDKPGAVLKGFFSTSTSSQILSLMKELALETAALIAKSLEGVTGELGLDIGVDLDGKIWLIEANSKPSKKQEGTSSGIRPSTKAIWKFSKTLWLERRDSP